MPVENIIFQIEQLPIHRPGPLKVDLRGNIIKKTTFTAEEFETFVTSKNVSVYNLSLLLLPHTSRPWPASWSLPVQMLCLHPIGSSSPLFG